MDLELEGKSVVVTAASKGLGKAIAMAFAKEKAHVLLSSRNEETLEAAVSEIKMETGNQNVDYAVCDMKKEADISGLINKAVAWNGTVNVLINNAGGPPAGSFMTMSDEDWYHAFELNLLSFVRTTRAVVPQMKEQKSGHIVNLSNTMRPGIVGLAKTLAQELSEHNILVNTVGPGTIKTGRVQELNEIRAEKEKVSVEEVNRKAEQSIPMRRLGRPEEFAKAVVFLASGANTYITGQSLIVDGGQVKAL